MTSIAWTHPSVKRILEPSPEADPISLIEEKARQVALSAMEAGWDGPPYDPFELADALGIETVARQDLDDARLVQADSGPRIEFNSQRRHARIRYSIAHEIGHFLFPDYSERVRYRDLAQRRSDDWQLEILCNVAAAELLMPIGAIPIRETENLSLAHLLDQRQRLGVSTEALLRRVVRLTNQAGALFAAARLGDSGGFRIDYLVGSRAWKPNLAAGHRVSPNSVLSRCTAVGYSDHATERWTDEDLLVQAVGVPPYPGDSYPRVIGLVQPDAGGPASDVGLRYVRGDATDPRTDGPAVVAHVVNDRARSWGGRGFAISLGRRYPQAREEYATWENAARRLGNVHLGRAGTNLWIASLVAQAGYGDSPSGQSRLRLPALRESLGKLATIAKERDATVHMPLIGTGQGRTPWPRIRDLILEELADDGVVTTVYVLPDVPMPDDAVDPEQLTLI